MGTGLDLFQAAGIATSADMPASLLAQISRVNNLPYSAVFRAPQDVIDLAREWLPIARTEATTPATEHERKQQFAMLAQQSWFVPDALRRGDELEHTVFWAQYHSDLAEVPAVVLAEACAMARTNALQRGLPTSGELLAYAKSSPSWRSALARAEGLRRLAEARAEGKRELASEEQWGQLGDMLKRMRADVEAEKISR